MTLIDTGFERTGSELVETLDAAVDGIDRLVLTHDGGVEHVMERFDPALYAPADEQGLLDAIAPDPDATFTDGDVLDGADRRGLPEGFLLPPPETYNHDHAAAERNLFRLLEYEFDAVYVFHGSHVTTDPKAKLDRYLNFRDHYR